VYRLLCGPALVTLSILREFYRSVDREDGTCTDATEHMMTGHPFLRNIAFALPDIAYLGGHPERLRFLQYGDVFTRAYRTWDI